MHRFRQFIALIFCLAVVLSHPALAAVDAAGAAHLKQILENNLSSIQESVEEDGSKLIRDGELMVEPSGAYYAVTYPHISIKSPDSSSIDIGMISANIMPGDKPELWKVAMAIPSPITYYDPAGNPAIMFSIGKQFFTGIWHEKLENYVNLKANYQNVRVVSADKAFNLNIPGISLIYDLKQAANGFWSGPADFLINGFQLTTQDSGSVKIDRINYKAMIADMSIEAQAAFREQMSALTESYSAGEDSSSPAHLAGVYNLVFNYIGNSMDGFTSSLNANNVEIRSPAATNKTSGLIKLAKAGFAFDMTGFRKNQVSMRIGMDYDGFAMTPIPESFDGTTPKTVNIDLLIEKLPYKELVDLGRTSLMNATQQPDSAQIVGMQALMSLPQLFTQAGTGISITDIFFSAKDYESRTSGNFIANLKAVNGLTGKARTEITGLENLIAILGEQSKNPKTSEAAKQQLSQTLATLTILQAVGQQDINEKGRPTRAYDLVIDEKGQILLNGADIKNLMGMQPETTAPSPKEK